MANGNANMIEMVRNYRARGEKIPAKLRDDLLFGAIIDLYDEVKVVRQMRPWFTALKWALGILGAANLALLWGLLTHTFAWPF